MKKYILWIGLVVFCSVILSCQTGKDNKFLFNLKDDPNETVDLSEKYPEKVKNLSTECDDFFRSITVKY